MRRRTAPLSETHPLKTQSDAAIRSIILPLFRGLGFQRVTTSVLERWEGDPARPDLYLRMHLSRAPGFVATDDEATFNADLEVHHPRLHAEGSGWRVDGKGRYSPSLRAEQLKRPVDADAWRDPAVSAILRRAWSLRYTAAYSDLMLLRQHARRFEDLADALERDSGVALVSERGAA
jgi:hypothetical protein